MDSTPRYAPPGAFRPVGTALPDAVCSVETSAVGPGPDRDAL